MALDFHTESEGERVVRIAANQRRPTVALIAVYLLFGTLLPAPPTIEPSERLPSGSQDFDNRKTP